MTTDIDRFTATLESNSEAKNKVEEFWSKFEKDIDGVESEALVDGKRHEYFENLVKLGSELGYIFTVDQLAMAMHSLFCENLSHDHEEEEDKEITNQEDLEVVVGGGRNIYRSNSSLFGRSYINKFKRNDTKSTAFNPLATKLFSVHSQNDTGTCHC